MTKACKCFVSYVYVDKKGKTSFGNLTTIMDKEEFFTAEGQDRIVDFVKRTADAQGCAIISAAFSDEPVEIHMPEGNSIKINKRTSFDEMQERSDS